MSSNAVISVYKLNLEAIRIDFQSRDINITHLTPQSAVDAIMDPSNSTKDKLDLPYSANLNSRQLNINTQSLIDNSRIFNVSDSNIVSSAQYKLFFGQLLTNEKWGNFFGTIDQNANQLHNLQNSHYSFLFFVFISGNIYVLTSGLAYHQISRYIDDYFGVTTLSHLIDTNSTDIRSLQDNAIYGNVVSSDRYFSDEFKIFNEDTFGKIYKKVLATISSTALSTNFPFIFDPTSTENRNCLGKSCFTVYKSIDANLALLLIFKLHTLYIRGMNPRLDISNIKILKSSDPVDKNTIAGLNDAIIDDFIGGMLGSTLNNDYLISAKNAAKYYSGHDYQLIYRPASGPQRIIYSTQDINQFQITDVIRQLQSDTEFSQMILTEYSSPNMNGKFLRLKSMFNKITIKVSGHNYPIPIYDVFFNYLITEQSLNTKNYFLINGAWFIFESPFVGKLNTQVTTLLNSIEDNSLIPYQWLSTENEHTFIEKFTNPRLSDYYPIHRITPAPNNVELADIIKIDPTNNKIYLIHIKKSFDNKIREVSSQVTTSAKLLHDDIKSNNYTWLKKIYQDVSSRNTNSSYFTSMKSKFLNKWPTEQSFINEFITRNVVYCIGYTGMQNNVSVRTVPNRYTSQIAKITLISLDKQFNLIKDRSWDIKMCQIQRGP